MFIISGRQVVGKEVVDMLRTDVNETVELTAIKQRQSAELNEQKLQVRWSCSSRRGRPTRRRRSKGNTTLVSVTKF